MLVVVESSTLCPTCTSFMHTTESHEYKHK